MVRPSAPVATPPESPSATPAGRLRYLIFGRLVPGVLFAYLGYLQVHNLNAAYAHIGSDDVFQILGGPVRLSFYFLFCVIPVLLYVTRPMPRARDGSLPARAAALAGTTILVWVGAFTQGPALQPLPEVVNDIASVVLAIFTVLEVYTLLNLRLNFSIIPEARRLVQTGPYHLVRHPLYFTEIVVAVAVAVSGTPHVIGLLALAPFMALQYYRTRTEEALLSRTFPEYAEYARHTARLIPFIW